MPRLYDKASGRLVGTVSDADLQVLIDVLEEEDQEDDDYFVNSGTLDLLEEAGGSPEMLSLLRAIIGATDGVELRYEV